MYYGVLHDYLYFSEPWDCNGTHYEAGYYDENGVRYDSVVMKNESGDNTVTITCQYCGSTVKIDWKEGDLPACSHCGAPLQLEDVQSDTISSSRQYGDPVTDNSEKESPDNSKKHSRLGRILLLLIAVITGLGVRSVFRASDIQTPEEIGNTESAYVTTTDSNTQIYGTSVYLTESSDGIYELSGKDSYTKVLTWDQETECYYDSSSGAYLWYNTDMTPALWQYWFEGISSRYDSGWMEYENGTWYIETREGEWEEYTGSTAGLWHIENRFDS